MQRASSESIQAKIQEKRAAGDFSPLASKHVSGALFYLQYGEQEKLWAWSFYPIAPKPDILSRRDDIPVGMYGAAFSSVEDICSALAKLTDGDFEVRWFIPGYGATVRRIFRDGVLYRSNLDLLDAYNMVERLARTNRGSTWVIRSDKEEVEGVIRYPLSAASRKAAAKQ